MSQLVATGGQNIMGLSISLCISVGFLKIYFSQVY